MQKGLITNRGADIFVPLLDAKGPAGRSVSDVVLTGRLSLPEPDTEMLCDWSAAYDSGEPGFVENAGPRTPLGQNESLSAIEAATLQWAAGHQLTDVFSGAEVTPLVCQGAGFHTDANHFSEYLFCVVWLSNRAGLDLLFPNIDVRIPLDFGSIVFFDAAQPHGVVIEGHNSWSPSRYAAQITDPTQHFVSFDVPFPFAVLGHRMDIRLFHRDTNHAWPEALSLGARRVEVDRETGWWKFAKSRA